MKILVINGSAKGKGNTHNIAKHIEKHMKAIGNVNFSYLFLKDANIKPCRGCFLCFTKDDRICPQRKDDCDKIEKKMLGADGVIFACPVYMMNVTWVMKNFFDRLAYHIHRPCFFEKYALMLSTTAGFGLKQTTKYMSMIAEAWGFRVAGSIGIKTPPWPGMGDDEKTVESETKMAARNFYDAIRKKKEIKPRLSTIIEFRALRDLIPYISQYIPKDYEYYKQKGWLDKKARFFDNRKIGLFKLFLAALIEKRIKKRLKIKFQKSL